MIFILSGSVRTYVCVCVCVCVCVLLLVWCFSGEVSHSYLASKHQLCHWSNLLGHIERPVVSGPVWSVGVVCGCCLWTVVRGL